MGHNPEVGAAFMAALAPLRDRLFNRARTEGRREPVEACAADALVEAVCGEPEAEKVGERETATRSAAKVIVRVDLPAMLRGYPVRGEMCEIAGFGPVAVSAVRDLLDTADPFLAAVVTAGEAVVGVAHMGRHPRGAQRTALEWLYPTCAAQGCDASTFLEFDHRLDWARSHLTVFDLLDRLCSHHHDLKTRDGWALVQGRGKRPSCPPMTPDIPAGRRRASTTRHRRADWWAPRRSPARSRASRHAPAGPDEPGTNRPPGVVQLLRTGR